MKRYHEKKIFLDKRLNLRQIASLCDDMKIFCLYENGEEITIGMGRYIDICITVSDITLKSSEKADKVTIKDLCNDLENILSQIELEDWRMYGISNFSLARYTYGLDCASEKDELLHFFIPETEYRINKETVILRSIDQKKLIELEKKLERTFSNEKEFNKETHVDSSTVINYDEEYYKAIVAKGVDEIKNGEDVYKRQVESEPIVKALSINYQETELSRGWQHCPVNTITRATQNAQYWGITLQKQTR